MKRTILALVLMMTMLGVTAPSFAQESAGTSLGSVTLNRRVMADGQPLMAGTYQVRLTGETPKPAVGQSPDGERYVEFVKAGKVVGREVATVVPAADVAGVAKWHKPGGSAASVELLRGNDYLRVWINHSGTHYIINLPVDAAAKTATH